VHDPGLGVIQRVRSYVLKIPVDAPESDGTLEWDTTTMVLVEVWSGSASGLGWTYCDASVAGVVDSVLAPVLVGRPVSDIRSSWAAMVAAVRNIGRAGVAACAISALDVALWDLKARTLGVPLIDLLGRTTDHVALYGSGGFTSYDDERLREQLGGWAGAGMHAVKLKVGRCATADIARIEVARDAVGADVALFIDANGAYSRKQALGIAGAAVDLGVTWFEEPVSSDDLEGLRLLRDRAPAPIEIAAGEYGYDTAYFARMLAAGAVDVLQADATRCGGVTGFLQVASLCAAAGIPLSAHTAPALHAAVCCAAPGVRHLEWFHDHARIEAMVLDGAPKPVDGRLRPDPDSPGLGVELRHPDLERWLTWQSEVVA